MAKPQKLQPVKAYFSELNGERIRLVMYSNGKKYGVVTELDGAVATPDYKGGGEELRTFFGNESQVVDWTTIEIANDRYTTLLTKILNQGNTTKVSSKPTLRVVHG